jgi:hypothetical protein
VTAFNRALYTMPFTVLWAELLKTSHTYESSMLYSSNKRNYSCEFEKQSIMLTNANS